MCYARRQRSSWARIKLSKSLYQNILSDDSICFRVLLLASFTFCLSSILIQRIVRDPFRTYFICFVLLSCCSIFKDHFPAPAIAATLLLYHFLPRLSIPFSKVFSPFFKVFSRVKLSRYPPPSFVDSLHILPLLFRFVKLFFRFF